MPMISQIAHGTTRTNYAGVYCLYVNQQSSFNGNACSVLMVRRKKCTARTEEIPLKGHKIREGTENLSYKELKKTGIVHLCKKEKEYNNKSHVHCGCILAFSHIFRVQTTHTWASLSAQIWDSHPGLHLDLMNRQRKLWKVTHSIS